MRAAAPWWGASLILILIAAPALPTAAAPAAGAEAPAEEVSGLECAAEAGGGGTVANGRTDRGADTNPKSLRLPPGRYEVVVIGIELADEPEERRPGVAVEPGGGAEVEVQLTSGELRVGAVQGSALVDATVQVFRPDGGAAVASGRTYTAASSNPKSFTLSPGRYRVVIAAVRLPGKPDRSLEVTVEAGGTTTVTAEFGGG